MADIRIENLTKRFDNFVAVDNVSLTIADREFVVLLGPSGCGKTTLLRAIAGLGMADEGRISIGGRDVTYLPPRDRKISMVFQSYANFPHMTVYDNVAFGLKMNKVDRHETDKRVRDASALLHIENMLDRYPSKMSGGKRQRVAVARAIAMRSEVLLMDDPLSNLDALLRLEMRAELKRLLQETKATTIYVTHDQIEALSMGDRIAVLWGSMGSGDGQFIEPYSLAVDTFGKVYVADRNNARIQKFDSNGKFLAKWGSAGNGNGQFSEDLADLAVDGQGNVYVTDRSNAIQKFDSNGQFIAIWDVCGEGQLRFIYSTTGVAVDTEDNLYVSEISNNFASANSTAMEISCPCGTVLIAPRDDSHR